MFLEAIKPRVEIKTCLSLKFSPVCINIYMVINMKLTYIVDKEVSGKTVKHVLKNKLQLSERLIKKLKYNNLILRNNEPVYVNVVLNEHDVLEVNMKLNENSEDIIPQDIPVDIIFEDENLLVLNKQPDIVVHPTCSHTDGTLANAVAFHLANKDELCKIRPVVRLDRDTSGVIIFAKNPYSQEYLIRQMNSKTFIKEYIGIVHGFVKNKKGTINLPISRKPDSIMLRHVSPDGDHAVTHYEVIEYLNNATVLRFILETGRTHQIRVHCQASGHPLIGDTLYPYLDDISHSSAVSQSQVQMPELINRQALHSYRALFEHPATKEMLEVIAPLAEDIKTALEILRK